MSHRHRSTRRHVRRAAGSLSLALAASLVSVGTASTAAAHPGHRVHEATLAAVEPSAQDGSLLVLDSLERVTTSTNKRGYVRWLDTGFSLTAPGSGVALWSARASYEDPIITHLRTDDGATQLPPGVLKRFGALPGFLSVTVTEVGKRRPVLETVRSMCLSSGWGSTRIRPDAAPTSDYPEGCGGGPYSLGSVMGIEGGWSTRMEPPLRRLKADAGRYDMTISVNPRWREIMGLSPEDATTTTRLRIREPRRGRTVRSSWMRYARQAQADQTLADQSAPGDEPVRPVSTPPAGTPVPDLRSLPAWQIQLNREGTVLRFGATVWNAGESPLVIDGFRDSDNRKRMTTYQYFFDGEEQVGYQQVGEMRWHAANHNHWHLDDFAKYVLLDADGEQVVKSAKRSFCLANTDMVDYTVPGANWNPYNTDLSTACGDLSALSVREVLDSGSGDTYHQYRAGQAFRISDLPDGVYYVATIANPLGNLVESDTTNNESRRKIQLVTTPRGRKVIVEQIGDIDENVRTRGSYYFG
ncbi:hypothetical protein KLP28_13205 [Nocardioidaceae bacterium]|nr:hypothetical protein KLP28_13205 [Nocardioidaceae bacterium]